MPCKLCLCPLRKNNPAASAAFAQHRLASPFEFPGRPTFQPRSTAFSRDPQPPSAVSAPQAEASCTSEVAFHIQKPCSISRVKRVSKHGVGRASSVDTNRHRSLPKHL